MFDGLEMVRPDTETVPAQVINDQCRWTIGPFEADSMGGPVPPLEPEHAVGLLARPNTVPLSDPHPATVRAFAVLVDLRPEPLLGAQVLLSSTARHRAMMAHTYIAATP